MDCCRCCDMDGCRTSPPRFGAGVLMNIPGVGRCGVVGTWKFMVDVKDVVNGRDGLGESEL